MVNLRNSVSLQKTKELGQEMQQTFDIATIIFPIRRGSSDMHWTKLCYDGSENGSDIDIAALLI
jgi:hypothetical protein